jgi:hypothetical protein
MFLEERARRELKESNNTEEIKKWEKEITRAYETFNVSNGVCA